MKPYSEDDIAALLIRYLQGSITPDERTRLESWKNASPANLQQFKQLTSPRILRGKLKIYADLFDEKEVYPEQDEELSEDKFVPKPLGIVKSIQRRWLPYAVAVAIIVAVLVLFTPWTKKETRPLAEIKELPQQKKPNAINSAVLELEDGTTILLDSVLPGQLTSQQHVMVLKTGEGKLKYEPGSIGKSLGKIGVNTIRTPRGRQYQLLLPDGSSVWLNAASSVTFPPVFDEKERKITVTGEVYIEVAKEAARPFLVNVNNKEVVEVLGTHFNINAYDDEPFIRTTLLEGRVKVARGEANTFLKPGEQAMVNAAGLMQKSTGVNIEQVVAWTKGKLAINSADFKGLMRQISRWYDVDVVFNGPVPDLRVGGFIQRGVNVSTVLDFLKGNGIKYDFDGRVITIH